MRINGYNQISMVNAYNNKKTTKVSNQPSDNDTFIMSKEAKDFTKVMGEYSDKDREKKIEELRKSIKEGTYKVSSEKIANGMIKEMKGV